MEETKYEVLIDNEVIAREMRLDIASVLQKALFEHYYNEPTLMIGIRKMAKATAIGYNTAPAEDSEFQERLREVLGDTEGE